MNNNNDLSRKLREHVDVSDYNLEAKKTSNRAIDMYEGLRSWDTVTAEKLDPILSAMKSRYSGPYFIGTELFLSLINQYPALMEILEILISSKSAHDRWVAISLVRDERIPDDLALSLIRAGINDKSAKVRLFAIESVYTRSFFSLVDDLVIMAKKEKNPSALECIEWVINRMKY